jgi:transposase-like protein
MELNDFYSQYPTQSDCIKHLEHIVWNGSPVCPYCNSKYNTTLKNEERKHCNTCNTSFSVTVNKIFHKTKADLQKWFYAIYLIKNGYSLTSRGLAAILGVTKDTANKMINAINKELAYNSIIIQL